MTDVPRLALPQTAEGTASPPPRGFFLDERSASAFVLELPDGANDDAALPVLSLILGPAGVGLACALLVQGGRLGEDWLFVALTGALLALACPALWLFRRSRRNVLTCDGATCRLPLMRKEAPLRGLAARSRAVRSRWVVEVQHGDGVPEAWITNLGSAEAADWVAGRLNRAAAAQGS